MTEEGTMITEPKDIQRFQHLHKMRDHLHALIDSPGTPAAKKSWLRRDLATLTWAIDMSERQLDREVAQKVREWRRNRDTARLGV